MTSVYTNLLSNSRFRPSEVTDRHILLEAESDRGRLLFCPAFRRLQQKAQVFSMESNASVRSRLTHSLEVAQVGRYIADQISIKLIEKELASREECAALTTFVETACLMHDIGNPPFGHFGEFAISEWFRNNGRLAIKRALKDSDEELTSKTAAKALADFYEFDGNPQGIRIVAKLQRNTDEYGLNLTKTTLAAYLKYVRSSGVQKTLIDSPFVKKCGYFSTESEIVESVWEEFGYDKPQRFPLAYIMEAADDIAYCISDLEDSIEKGLLNESIAFKEILEQWSKAKVA
ncbi:dGTP triphosphohydrolase, partial [Pseudomonas protegens]|nr:dNTP triphosphohydrolase [Pseudomonas protegens]